MPVWLAHDEVLGKDVSLHFLPQAVLGDPRGMAELRQEVKRNRQLIHPSILRVYDFVEDAGFAAISMDRFEGNSLAVVLKKNGKVAPAELQTWIQQLSGTLDDAHRVQLFHRDLSPSNVYVKPTGGIFVTNFGVSRSIRDVMKRTGSLPQDALHLAYISPQQLAGEKPAKSDDVYGLGVFAFEMLTGKLPFEGNDIVLGNRTTAAPKVSEVLGAEIPHAWDNMIAACLSENPEFRPANCSSAAALLSSGSEARPGVVPASPVPAEVVKPPAAKESDPAPSAVPPTRSHTAERRMNFGGGDAVMPAATAPLSGAAALAKAPMEKAVPPADEKVSAPNSPQLPPAPPEVPKNRASGPKSDLPANFPELARPRSKWPVIGVGLAAGILAFAVVQKMKVKTPQVDESSGAVTQIQSDEALRGDPSIDPGVSPGPASDDLPKPNGTVVQPPPDEPLPLPKPNNQPSTQIAANTAELVAPEALQGQSAENGAEIKPPAVVPKPKRPGIIGADFPPLVPPKGSEGDKPTLPQTNVTTPPVAPPAEKTPAVEKTPPVEKTAPVLVGASIKLPVLPEVPPKLQIQPAADSAALEKLMNERVAAEAALKQAAGAAEQAQQEIARLSDAAKKNQDALRKTLDERQKTLAPALKENEALLADRKKREDEMAKTEALALEARKSADAAKAALDALVQQSGSKLEAVKKATDELRVVAGQLGEQQKQAEELSKNLTQVTSLRQQAGIGLLQLEKEKGLITAAIEKAKASAMDAMRAQNQAKIAEIQKQVQRLEADAKKSEGILAQLKELGDAGAAASKPIVESLSALQGQIKGLRDEMTKLGGAGAVVVPPVTPTGTPPVKPPTPALTPAPVSDAGNGANSVGMKFVQVGDVDFAVYMVTRKDFEAFATEKGMRTGMWRTPGYAQGPDHPVASVTWKEADAFCKWLTERERKNGLLSASQAYRLPTDLEWSRAVGLPPEKGATPEDRDLSSDLGIADVFPWGLDWPPPPGAGNYAGEENDSEVKIQGYRDDYVGTSPVGKFKPNAFGLFDMGGNLWQWTSDYINNAKEKRVLRGGSWYNGGLKLTLLASSRIGGKPDEINDTYGFRVVRTRDVAKAVAKPK